MLNEDGDPIEMVLGNDGPIQFVIHEAGNVNSTERSLEVVTNTWWDSFTYALCHGCPTVWHLGNVNSGSSSIFHVTLMTASVNVSSNETKIWILYIMFYSIYGP